MNFSGSMQEVLVCRYIKRRRGYDIVGLFGGMGMCNGGGGEVFSRNVQTGYIFSFSQSVLLGLTKLTAAVFQRSLQNKTKKKRQLLRGLYLP